MSEFAPDGKKLYYKVVKQASSSWDAYGVPGEVRVMDLETGRSEVVMPGFEALDYDLSADGEQIVMEIADRDGTSRFWIAAFDRASPPRQIPGVEGKQPRFGRDGDILFRRTEGSTGFVYRVRPDGTGMRKVFEQPIFIFGGISRDGRWIKAFTMPAGNEGRHGRPCRWMEDLLFQLAPLRGIGPPPRIRWPFRALRSPQAGVISFRSGQDSSYRWNGGKDFVPNRNWPHCRARVASTLIWSCPGLPRISTRSIARRPSAISIASLFDSTRQSSRTHIGASEGGLLFP